VTPKMTLTIDIAHNAKAHIYESSYQLFSQLDTSHHTIPNNMQASQSGVLGEKGSTGISCFMM